MTERYSAADYADRCSDIELAVEVTVERIAEWDGTEDPHGWWHERPSLIAFVNAVRSAQGRPAITFTMDQSARPTQAMYDDAKRQYLS